MLFSFNRSFHLDPLSESGQGISFFRRQIMENTCSKEITELAEAMIQVQQSLVPAQKDGDNPFTNSRYATLHSVFEACRGALLSHGIWVTQYLVPVEAGNLGLVSKIVHAESGQWLSLIHI